MNIIGHNIPKEIYEKLVELEHKNIIYRQALEFYMKYYEDSRNMGVVTEKIKKALDEKE